MKLDRDRVVEALGEKAGGLFLALARSGVPSQLQDSMQPKIQEYLGFLEDHLTLEGSTELRGFFRMDIAKDLAARWTRLLELAEEDQDPERRLLVTTGVRYYVTPHDAESEIEVRTGYRDDVQVINFVIQETGLAVQPMPAPEFTPEDEAPSE